MRNIDKTKWPYYESIKERCTLEPERYTCPKCDDILEHYIDDVKDNPHIQGDKWPHWICPTCVCDWIQDVVLNWNSLPQAQREASLGLVELTAEDLNKLSDDYHAYGTCFILKGKRVSPADVYELTSGRYVIRDELVGKI